MRAIHIVQLDKSRPAVILTRESVRDRLHQVTVAAITSRRRGLAVEVPVGSQNGLHESSVVNCDNVFTVAIDKVGRQVGRLLDEQEDELADALVAAFDLRV